MKKIVFFASGSGSNIENIVQYFTNRNDIQFDSIFVNNPNAFVLERAKKLNIPTYIFNKEDFEKGILLEKLKEIKPDLIVLAGFLWLMPTTIINSFPNKIINIHPALLPKYGGKGMYGMRVHESVKLQKEKQTGITIHYVNNHYDEGEIILQKTCEISREDTIEQIAEKVHSLEYQWFPKAIEKILNF